jgi:hypothetical protein
MNTREAFFVAILVVVEEAASSACPALQLKDFWSAYPLVNRSVRQSD